MSARLTLNVSRLSAAVIGSLAVLASLAGCGLADTASAVATPTVGLNRTRVPLGGPLELTYRFTVAQDAGLFADDYLVFVHFLDADGDLMFTADHAPPQSTTSWQPGQEVSYDRRMIVPVYPYIGEVTVALGLYSPTTGDRLPLAGMHLGQRSYEVATLEMAPQSESGFLMYEDGWHAAESEAERLAGLRPRFSEPPEVSDREWRWTTGHATLSFRNPQTDSTLYLEVDGRPELFESPQILTLSIGDTPIETIELGSAEPSHHIVPVSGASLGGADTVTLTLTVDPSFVPSEVTNGANNDDRELGMQVFYAFLEEN